MNGKTIYLIGIVCFFLSAFLFFQSISLQLTRPNDDIQSASTKSLRKEANEESTDDAPAPTLAPLTKDFIRAVAFYFPTNNVHKFLPQLKWFMRSWIEMRKTEPSDWRTDIVIIIKGNKEIDELKNLNCTLTPRRNRKEAARCIVVLNYVPLSKREEAFKHYGFGDSVGALVDEKGSLDEYDWLLRSDLDTFLTPAFANWRPKKMVVGVGAYCFDGQITCHRLHRIARDMKWKDAGIDNIGSTWYGPTKVIKHCAKSSIEAMTYLHKWEFSKTGKDPKHWMAVKDWPSWHFGVLTMYGGQLAINNCGKDFGFEKRSDLLDFATTSSDKVDKHPHLHTWQNSKTFSKFSFSAGKYDNIDPSKLDISKVKDYAMIMALESKL